jgi:hypothetical protein
LVTNYFSAICRPASRLPGNAGLALRLDARDGCVYAWRS